MDCNAWDKEGNTAVMYACALGKTEAVRSLVEAYRSGKDRKLDVRKINLEGYCALDFAIDNEDEDAYYLIMSLLYCKKYYDSSEDSDYDEPIPDFRAVVNTARHGTENSRCRIEKIAVTVENPRSSQTKTDIHKDNHIQDATTSALASQESVIPTKKSVLNVHLPKTVDDYVEGAASTPSDDLIHTYTFSGHDTVQSADPTRHEDYGTKGETIVEKTSKQSKRRGKKSKRKKKRRGQPDGNEDEENAFMIDEQHRRLEFGEEIMLCNRIYGAEPSTSADYNLPGDDPIDRDLARTIINDLTRKATGTFNAADVKEKTESYQETGRFSFFSLTPQDKAKLLGRTIWSAYRTPLPPIPISQERMEQVIRGIQRLRRFLHIARHGTGRLVKLDPELWCIVESIKMEICLKAQQSGIMLPPPPKSALYK